MGLERTPPSATSPSAVTFFLGGMVAVVESVWGCYELRCLSGERRKVEECGRKKARRKEGGGIYGRCCARAADLRGRSTSDRGEVRMRCQEILRDLECCRDFTVVGATVIGERSAFTLSWHRNSFRK
jgi:hypothetical protein